MAIAPKRTSFTVPGLGRVTLAKGETCPEAWEDFAPDGAFDAAPQPDPTVAIEADPKPVSKAAAKAPSKTDATDKAAK